MQSIQSSVESHLIQQERMSPSNSNRSVCDKSEVNSVNLRRDSFSSCSSDSAVYCSSRHMKIQGIVPDVSKQLKSCNNFQVSVTSDIKRERHSSDSSSISVSSNNSILPSSKTATTTTSCVKSSESFEYGCSDALGNSRPAGNKLTSRTNTSCTYSSSSKTIMHEGSNSFSHKTVSKPATPQTAVYHHDLRKNIRRKKCFCPGGCNETHTTIIVRRYADTAPCQQSPLHTSTNQNTSSSNTSSSSLESSPNSNKKRKSEVDILYDSLHEIKWAKHFSPENILKQNEARRISPSSKSLSVTEDAVKSKFSPRVKRGNFVKLKTAERNRDIKKKHFSGNIKFENSASSKVENSASINVENSTSINVENLMCINVENSTAINVENSTSAIRRPEICSKINAQQKSKNVKHITARQGKCIENTSIVQDSLHKESLLSDTLFHANTVSSEKLKIENLSCARKSSNTSNHLFTPVKPDISQIVENADTSKPVISFHKVAVNCKPDVSKDEYFEELRNIDTTDVKEHYIPFDISNKVQSSNRNQVVLTESKVTYTLESNSDIKANLPANDSHDNQSNANLNVQSKFLKSTAEIFQKINTCRTSSPYYPNIVQLHSCDSSEVDFAQNVSLEENVFSEEMNLTASTSGDAPPISSNSLSPDIHIDVHMTEEICPKELNIGNNTFAEEVEACSRIHESLELPLLSSEDSPTKTGFVSELPPVLEPSIIFPQQNLVVQQNQLSVSENFVETHAVPSTEVSDNSYCEEVSAGNDTVMCGSSVNVMQLKRYSPHEAESEVSSMDDIEILEHQTSDESDCVVIEPEEVHIKQHWNETIIRRQISPSVYHIGRLILKKYIRSHNKKAILKTKFKRTILRGTEIQFEATCDQTERDQRYDSDEGNQSFDSLEDISLGEISNEPSSKKMKFDDCEVQSDNDHVDNRTTISQDTTKQEHHAVKGSFPNNDESKTHFHFSPANHVNSNEMFADCSSEERTQVCNSSCLSDTDTKPIEFPIVKHRPYIHGIKKSAVEDNQLTLFPTNEPAPAEDEVPSEEETEIDAPEEILRLRLLYGFTLHYKGITVNKNDSYTQVIMKLSSKKNIYLSIEALTELRDTLNNAENDSNCQVLIVSGIGSSFCSGLDLKPLIGPRRKDAAKEMAVAVKEFIEALASFHKPLVAVVNGSAVGLGVTLLTYCDVVLASNTATFRMPYSQLGYMPEGAATLTLPQVVGATVAMDMLLRGRKMTARQALDHGLVSEVLEVNKLPHQLVSRVRILAENPVTSMESTKSMLRWHLYGKLHVALENEVEMLPKQWLSPTCQMALKNAFQNGLLGD